MAKIIVHIDLNAFSLIIKRHFSLPMSQVALLPVAFIVGYLKGIKESNIDEIIVDHSISINDIKRQSIRCSYYDRFTGERAC